MESFKLRTMILLLSVFILDTISKTVTLHESGAQSFKITYGYPQEGEESRVQFHLTGTTLLTSTTRSSLVCIDTGSSSFTVADGATVNAFGITFICNSDSCSDSLTLNPFLYGSEVTFSSSSYNWAIANRVDISLANKGGMRGDGLAATTIYGMNSSMFSSSNIPAVNTTKYLKCFAQYAPNSTAIDIEVDRDVTNWATADTTVGVSDSDYSCLKVADNDTCGAYELMKGIPVVIVLIIVYFLLSIE